MGTATTNYCVACGDEDVRHGNKQMEFDVRGETMQFDVPIKVCAACGVVEQADVDPAELAFAQYRQRNGLLTPREIKDIRERYKLSQKSLAAILGMSEATINRYEGGGLQGKAHDQAIRSCASAEGMRDLLSRCGHRLSDWQRQRAEDALNGISGNLSGVMFDMTPSGCMPKEKSLATGFREFDYRRYAAVVVWFCGHMNTVTVTSLNKLLFYADFLHFRTESVSLTGAAYRRAPYGPVPAAYGELREHLEWEQVIEVREVVYQNGNMGEEIHTGAKAEELSSQLTPRELKTLEAVANKFANFSPSKISEYSHQEAAWQGTEDRALISYDKAGQLSLL